MPVPASALILAGFELAKLGAKAIEAGRSHVDDSDVEQALDDVQASDDSLSALIALKEAPSVS